MLNPLPAALEPPCSPSLLESGSQGSWGLSPLPGGEGARLLGWRQQRTPRGHLPLPPMP